MTRLRASLLRWARAAILDGVEAVEGHVGHMGPEMDGAAAALSVEVRAAVGKFTDALLVEEAQSVARLGRLG